MPNRGGNPFGKKAAGHKYGAEKTPCGYGHEHPSKKEARRCAELHMLERAGEISELEREPVYHFTVNGVVLTHDRGQRARFRPDFRYRLRDGRLVVEDSKGVSVRDWPLRKALFKACYPEIELVES